MRVVANHAIEHNVLPLEQVAIAAAVLDKTIADHQPVARAAAVAFFASPRIAIDLHVEARRVTGMQAAGAVTGFTAYAFLRPGAGYPSKIVLIAARVKAR